MATPTRLAKLRVPGQPQLSRAQDSIARMLEPVAAAVQKTPLMGAPPPPWIRPEKFAADFVDSGGFAATSFHRDALGYTWARVAATTAAGSGPGAALFTFPPGYRPGGGIGAVGFNTTTAAIIAITISSTGLVNLLPIIGAGQGVAATFSFLAER